MKESSPQFTMNTTIGAPKNDETMEAFFNKLDEIESQAKMRVDYNDVKHLRKLESWCNWIYLIGLGTAWVYINPISIYLISQAKFSRWTCMAHHVLHGAYDKIEGVPNRLTSRKFAKGIRRGYDWFDWIIPTEWSYEHNLLHHYHLGENSDPDQVENNLEWLREKKYPTFIKWCIVLVLACTWKFIYYNSNTILEDFKKKSGDESLQLSSKYIWNPIYPPARRLLFFSILPYLTFNFVLLPALFFVFSKSAGYNVLVSMIIAEILTNVHSFVMIVTNHAGNDIFRFEKKLSGKKEFMIRQIIGSTNYTTGGDKNDFFHGFLNYQIEHHLWPKMTMRQYQWVQPQVKKLCKEYGVLYTQESFIRRIKKTVDIMIGVETMKAA
ncbi:MAG: fatty acid desaturase [Bacteroidota bacterium]